MSDDLKMYIAMGIFMGLPIAIMGLAWLTDRLDRLGSPSTDRPSDR